MTVKSQPENAVGTLWSATVADGQQGWFEIQMERGRDSWDWAINHDRRLWGEENTLEQAKSAVAVQLEQTGQHFPRCEICRFTENESGEYLMSVPDSPASWRTVPCPRKRSGGGATHSMCTGTPCGGRKSRRQVSRRTRAKGGCEVRSGSIAIHPAILRIAASANQQIGRSHTKPDAQTNQENCIAISAAAALLDQERHELTAEGAYKKLPEFKGDRVLEKQISSLSRRDETPSSTTGRNEIIDDCFWVSHDYQRLSSKIGRSGRLLALLGLPLSSNAEEWLRLRPLLRGGKRIARWR